jgi:ADP-ribosylglycohydrolase
MDGMIVSALIGLAVLSRWPSHSSGFANAVRVVHEDLRRLPTLESVEVAERYFPNQPMTIIPLALGLATVMQSAEEAIILAANIGGDSDSVASISGGILAAMAIPQSVLTRSTLGS